MWPWCKINDEELDAVIGGFEQVTPAAQLYGSVEDMRPPCEQDPVGISLEADPLTLGEAGLLPGDKPCQPLPDQLRICGEYVTPAPVA